MELVCSQNKKQLFVTYHLLTDLLNGHAVCFLGGRDPFF